jgi:hypothetical protein
MMGFAKNILRDLIDKRLWPVAIALIIALVAVPVVLGGGSESPAPDVAAVPATTSTTKSGATAKVVSLEAATTGEKITRDGKVRDPFLQHHVPKKVDDTPATTGTTTTDPATGTTTDTTTAPTTGGSDTGTGGTSTTPSTTTTTTKPKTKGSTQTYGVAFKFGEAGTQKSYKNVARLTPLPSTDTPFFVYLGLSDDGKSAIFLIDGDAEPSGDGTCLPSPDDCQQIALKVGDLEFLELGSGTGGLVQYQLEMTAITKTEVKNKATAAKARARESRAGREYIREIVAADPDALAAWSYSKDLGLLVPTRRDARAATEHAAVGQLSETVTTLTVPSP